MEKLKPNYKTTRLACYTSYFTMSSIFCVPPLLFVTFRESYGISYTLLGTLVLVNFFTQLGIDLIFTLFSKHFNAKWVIRVMPLITSLGLMTYALIPTLFPSAAYLGLVVGTVIFSISAGLSEVLLSPTIAAMPSDNPQRDMSLLHSLYAFGVFTMVLISTLFLKLFGTQSWNILVIILALLPIAAAVLFMLSPIPDITSAESTSPIKRTKERTTALAICFCCIFFGSCAETAMSTWISGYMETALGIDKAVGDILGVAMFAVLLGIARISYAKFGKNICRVLLLGMIGASVCYLVVALTSSVYVGFFFCILTGFCVAMLWPGTLIMMEEKISGAGVAAFALMASGGDLGASLAPQLMGIVIDNVAASDLGARLADTLSLTPEQIGLKAGMLTTAIFPLIGCVIVLIATRYFKKHESRLKSID